MIFVVYMIFPESPVGIQRRRSKPPGFPPSFFTREGYCFAPRFSQDTRSFFSLLQRHSGVNLLQVCCDLLDVLIADILGGTSDLVDDAALKPALWINRLNGLHHAAESICTEQINIHNSLALEFHSTHLAKIYCSRAYQSTRREYPSERL